MCETAGSRTPILITAASLAALGAFSPWGLNWTVAFLLMQVVVVAIVIWQACDSFADAAQWIGATFRLPGSVRGATLDAVASSMPELFSGVFFVLVPVWAARGRDLELSQVGGEGFGATLATCAGSAVYNMILIPAFCALFISYYRKSRPTIDVEPEVLSRDGLWFLGSQAVLIAFLYQDVMYWWMALVFVALYVVYIFQLYFDARSYQRAHDAIGRHLQDVGPYTPTLKIIEALRSEGIKPSPALVDKIRYEMLDPPSGGGEEDDPRVAGALFRTVRVPLNHRTAWLVILVSTAAAAAACYGLVEVTNQMAETLEVPVFFVAVILAAAASSVPDTLLSVMAAQRGDDSGAVSNAFGSNIFDICICLAIPLLVNAYLVNWQPVYLTDNGGPDGEPLAGLAGLRHLLWLLTIITLLIMWHNRQLTRRKAWALCGLYALFIAYAVAGSLGFGL